MFDFFSFKNNNSEMLKSAVRGAAIGAVVATTQTLELEVFSKEFGGLLVGVIALCLLLEYSLPGNGQHSYAGYQPGTDGKNNGFYLIEDKSTSFKM